MPWSIFIAQGWSILIARQHFEPSAFSIDSFAAGGIELPPSIACSVAKRQAEFYFGRLAARQALASLGFQSWAVGIGPSREPLWPSGVIGSISHCHGLAVAVALGRGPFTGIGIDAEDVIQPEMQEALLGPVVEDVELTLLAESTPAHSIEQLLTIAFSAKESFFKGAFEHVGRYFGFRAAQVVGLDPAKRCIRIALTNTLSSRLQRGRTFDIRYDFIGDGKVVTSFIW